MVTEIGIARPRAEVAVFASDPGNAPAWCVNIKSVEWETPPPSQVGSRSAGAPLRFASVAPSGTRMTLRNRGESSGFKNVAAPLMASAMRRANRKDLAKLKSLLEA